MAGISISIVGDSTGVQAMLMHLQSKLSPPSLGAFLLTQVDPYLRTRAEQRFQSEGDDVSGSWLPLRPATQLIRQMQGYGPDSPINRRTGELEDYILNTPSAVAVHAMGSTLTYPGNAPSGELADKMTTAQAGRNFPSTVARPVLGVNGNDLAAVLVMMALEIQRP